MSSRLWGGALRDEPKNGCEGDYRTPGTNKIRQSFIRLLFDARLPELYGTQGKYRETLNARGEAARGLVRISPRKSISGRKCNSGFVAKD